MGQFRSTYFGEFIPPFETRSSFHPYYAHTISITPPPPCCHSYPILYQHPTKPTPVIHPGHARSVVSPCHGTEIPTHQIRAYNLCSTINCEHSFGKWLNRYGGMGRRRSTYHSPMRNQPNPVLQTPVRIFNRIHRRCLSRPNIHLKRPYQDLGLRHNQSIFANHVQRKAGACT